MSLCTLTLRIEEETMEAIETMAEAQDASKSAMARDLLGVGLAEADEAPDYVGFEAARDRIQKQAKPAQYRAWFRTNVGKALLRAWNGGLTADEARDYLEGYRREAEELHTEEHVAYVADGLDRYEQARAEGRVVVLSSWIRDEVQEVLPEGENAPTDVDVEQPDEDPAEEEGSTTTKVGHDCPAPDCDFLGAYRDPLADHDCPDCGTTLEPEGGDE